MGTTFSPEQAQAIRDAFALARRTFTRRLTPVENQALAKAVVELAGKANGQLNIQTLATRAVVRCLR